MYSRRNHWICLVAWTLSLPVLAASAASAGTDFIIVDNFESYGGDQGARLYESWVPDPEVTNERMSVWPPLLEWFIVHGGGQSMELGYDNAFEPAWRGVKRQFEPPADWTSSGVDTLVVHVHGRPSNAPALFYLAVEDRAGKSAMVTYPGTHVLQADEWVQWRVPLSSFADVNLAAVTQFRLGTSNPVTATSPRGHFRTVALSTDDPNDAPAPTIGRIYIDDLWLAKASALPPEWAAECIYPAPEDANVPQTLVLRWSARSYATYHDVYFGTDPNAVANATPAPATADLYRGRQARDETTFDPGTLEWGTTYYWRVDEIGPADILGRRTTIVGPIWCFTTADFLVVDDFESYNNEEGQGTRIYETWTDELWWWGGIESMPIMPDPPYLEYVVVHSGRQSMPLEYNNVSEPWYSGASREFSPIQDWTVHGMDTLVLYVRGKATNAPQPLYVAVEDSAGKAAVAVHPDPKVLLSMEWVEWKIPLSSLLSVNVRKVKELYIGAGDRRNPTPGGAGRVYIDDIRVIKSTP